MCKTKIGIRFSVLNIVLSVGTDRAAKGTHFLNTQHRLLGVFLVWTEQITRQIFLVIARMCKKSHTTLTQGSSVVRVISSMSHAPVCLISLRPFLRTLRLSLLLHPPDLSLHLLCGSVRSWTPCALPRMRSLTLWSTTRLSQVMSPSSSTTTTSQRPLKFHPGVLQRHQALVPAWLRNPWHHRQSARFTTVHSGARTTSGPLTILYHSPEESLLSSRSLSVGHLRTERPVNEFGSQISNVRENPCRDSENEQIRILLERQKEQILADCPSRLWQKKHPEIEWSYRVSTR